VDRAIDDKLDEAIRAALDLPDGPVPPEISAETSEAWDSAGHMRVVLTVEQAFGLSFTIAEIESATSRAALRDLLVAKGV
jgi:acyl carrier protein